MEGKHLQRESETHWSPRNEFSFRLTWVYFSVLCIVVCVCKPLHPRPVQISLVRCVDSRPTLSSAWVEISAPPTLSRSSFESHDSSIYLSAVDLIRKHLLHYCHRRGRKIEGQLSHYCRSCSRCSENVCFFSNRIPFYYFSSGVLLYPRCCPFLCLIFFSFRVEHCFASSSKTRLTWRFITWRFAGGNIPFSVGQSSKQGQSIVFCAVKWDLSTGNTTGLHPCLGSHVAGPWFDINIPPEEIHGSV